MEGAASEPDLENRLGLGPAEWECSRWCPRVYKGQEEGEEVQDPGV